MKMDEEAVKRHVQKWLKDQGYEIVTISSKRGPPQTRAKPGRKALAPTPPDIVARRGTDYYYVEAKGDPPSATALYTALGQLVSKMAARTPTKYAIALSPGYEKFLHLLPKEVQKRVEPKINVIIARPEKEKPKRLPEIIEI